MPDKLVVGADGLLEWQSWRMRTGFYPETERYEVLPTASGPSREFQPLAEAYSAFQLAIEEDEEEGCTCQPEEESRLGHG